MVRQGDSQVFKEYSQMKLRMKREALNKINRRANEMSEILTQQGFDEMGFDAVLINAKRGVLEFANSCKCSKINTVPTVGV
jgi:hypothetical protein